jgi:hypothetical protein
MAPSPVGATVPTAHPRHLDTKTLLHPYLLQPSFVLFREADEVGPALGQNRDVRAV